MGRSRDEGDGDGGVGDHATVRVGSSEPREGDRAGVLVLSAGRVALIERHRDGQRYWVIPGGGIEPGETVTAAAGREAAEELGITIDLGGLQLVVVANRADGTTRHHWYFHATTTGEELRMGGPEQDRGPESGTYAPVWMPLDALPAGLVRPTPAGEWLAAGARPGATPVVAEDHW